jgi:hypothetical protein
MTGNEPFLRNAKCGTIVGNLPSALKEHANAQAENWLDREFVAVKKCLLRRL